MSLFGQSLPENRDARRMNRPWFASHDHPYTIEFGLNDEHPFVIPPFQRGLVWTLDQSTRFIESIWMQLPIGSYSLNRAPDSPFDNWLLDGQQRWHAIRKYVSGAFPAQGLRFPDLHIADSRSFLRHPFNCLETNYEDEATLRDIFERLAYGGTPNCQEAPR